MKRTPLARRSALRRRHPGAAAAQAGVTARLRRTFREEVLAHGGCVMCARLTVREQRALHGDTTRLDAHHVVRAQVMKRHGLPPEVVFDPAAGIPVCRFHHATHHAYRERIPRDVLPANTVNFLRAVGLKKALDREYPNPQVERKSQPEGKVEGRREAA